MSSPAAPVFDELVHAPLRLRACGLLSKVEALEFALLRDSLGVTDAHLSKNLKILSDAGYISMSKQASTKRGDARRLTWVSLTRQGRAALAGHVAALRQIADEL